MTELTGTRDALAQHVHDFDEPVLADGASQLERRTELLAKRPENIQDCAGLGRRVSFPAL